MIVATVAAPDVAGAVTIAWEAFRAAAAGDRLGWDLAAAAVEAQPEPKASPRRPS